MILADPLNQPGPKPAGQVIDGGPGEPDRLPVGVVDELTLALDPAQVVPRDGEPVLDMEVGAVLEGVPDARTQGFEVLRDDELLVLLHGQAGFGPAGVEPVQPREVGVAVQQVGVDHPVPKPDDPGGNERDLQALVGRSQALLVLPQEPQRLLDLSDVLHRTEHAHGAALGVVDEAGGAGDPANGAVVGAADAVGGLGRRGPRFPRGLRRGQVHVLRDDPVRCGVGREQW